MSAHWIVDFHWTDSDFHKYMPVAEKKKGSLIKQEEETNVMTVNCISCTVNDKAKTGGKCDRSAEIRKDISLNK